MAAEPESGAVKSGSAGGLASYVGSAVVLVLVFIAAYRYVPLSFGSTDFIQYWTASKRFNAGMNPYDPLELRRLQQQIMGPEFGTILMWNPPSILLLISPLSLIDFRLAKTVWFMLNLLCIVAALALSLRFLRFRPARPDRLYLTLVLLTFYPFMLTLGLGQLSLILLLAAVSLLPLITEPTLSSRWRFWLGASFAVTLLKPHLLYLIYPLWIGHSLTKGRKAEVAGFASGAAAFGLMPMLVTPGIYSDYLQAFATPPLYWQTPTLGSWLQLFSGVHTFWLRALPSLLIGGVVVFIYGVRRRFRISAVEFLILVPLSLISSPYGWVFDQALLLPLVVLIVKDLSRLVRYERAALVVVLMLSNAIMIAVPSDVGQQYFLWYPALILILASYLNCGSLRKVT